ncbi:Nmad2 family putative nucleotide modification protein [Agriterribacter humi]|uniref:Nmad2 family putative nucleotide modification protein n=1 Tax=Agriterribacter humi TaxID=1104781 RepID=UPI001D02A0EA|nr:hypothetical protein [Agriterribacter humi]
MQKMNFYSYKLDHDYGLAPNPFGEHCTLAVCKSSIRKNKNLTINDWVIGTGSKALGYEYSVIYAMQVQEIVTFDEYWSDKRFDYKKPVLNGSLVQMYGDNFYHTDKTTGEWIQEESAHSVVDKEAHLETDTNGKNVLISKRFWYMGDKAKKIPDHLIKICNKGRNMKYRTIDNKLGNEFILWMKENFAIGISGDPISWMEYYKL